MPQLNYEDYTVAWIAPLEIEAKAALCMLDERHEARFPVSRGDDYILHAGSMCGHNIVIATFPAGQEYGTGSAAALASHIRKSFPNLWFGLLVGVSAGLPNLERVPPRDIRLGDVLVALPDGEHAAVVAYDLGKETGERGFQPLRLGHVLAHTEPVVRSAIGKIKLNAPNDARIILPHYEKMKHEEHTNGTFLDPGQEQDQFFEINEQGVQAAVKRQTRPASRRTRIWYGPIGSGEKVMKNAYQRDIIRDKYNLIGLEMEAAGTMNRIPVGVIRGVCDYGDENKNKRWQPYAAAMAAAYAKTILTEIFPASRANVRHLNSDLDESNSRRHLPGSAFQEHLETEFSDGPRKRPRLGLTDSAGERSVTGPYVRSELAESLHRKNEKWPEYQNERPELAPRFIDRQDTPPQIKPNSETWCTSTRKSPWIVVLYGLAGAGKSQMCLKAALENETRFKAVFYVDAINETSANTDYMEISRVCGIQSYWDCVEVSERLRMTRAWLADQREPWLLLLDNADSTEIALDKYVPTRGRGTILITTTDQRITTCGSTFAKVEPLCDKEAFDLLMSFRRSEAKLLGTEKLIARELATEVLGGLPVALSQAGSYIFNNYLSYSDYLREFSKSPQASLNYHTQPQQWSRRRPPVWTTFELSMSRIQKLHERGAAKAIELLRTLCFLHHEGINEQIFQESWTNMDENPEISPYVALLDKDGSSWDMPDLRAAFGILCRYSLINRPSPPAKKYSMHRLVQVICKETMSEEQQAEYVLRAASLIATALSGIKTPLSWINNPSGLSLQKSVLPHIKACISGSAGNISVSQLLKNRAAGAKILIPFSKAYMATGHYSEAAELLKGLWVGMNWDSICLQAAEQHAACATYLGHHSEACHIRQKIVDMYHVAAQGRGLNSEAECVAMINLADSLWATGKRDDAVKMTTEALSLRKSRFTKVDPRVIRTQRKYAEYLHDMGQRRQALQIRESIMKKIETKVCGSDVEILDQLASTSALADSYQWDGRLLQALGLRQKVYDDRRRILGLEHPDTLLSYDAILRTRSSIAHRVDEKEEICELRRHAVLTWKRVVGDSHPHYLEAKVNLGRSYSMIRRWREALVEHQEVLEVRERQFDNGDQSANYINYVLSLNKVAEALTKLCKRNEAKKHRKKALEIVERFCVHTDLMTFKILNGLATGISSLHGEDSQQSKLERLHMRRSILHTQKTLLHPRHPGILNTLSHLASDLQNSGFEGQAVRTRSRLLRKQRDVFGPDNRETLNNSKKLAIALAIGKTGDADYEKSIGLMQHVEKVQCEHLGGDHPETQDTRMELYCITIVARRVDTALRLEEVFDLNETTSWTESTEDEIESGTDLEETKTSQMRPTRHQNQDNADVGIPTWRSVAEKKQLKYVHPPRMHTSDYLSNNGYNRRATFTRVEDTVVWGTIHRRRPRYYEASGGHSWRVKSPSSSNEYIKEGGSEISDNGS